MPLRMNMQSGRKHKSKLDVWENQWSGSLAAPLIFCYPLTKYFEMSNLCNNSTCFSVEIKGTSDNTNRRPSNGARRCVYSLD